MSTDKPTITREHAIEAMRALLGDDLDGVTEVRVNLSEVTVTRFVRDDDGNALVFNDELAYQEQAIPIERPRSSFDAIGEAIGAVHDLRADVAAAFASLADATKPEEPR